MLEAQLVLCNGFGGSLRGDFGGIGEVARCREAESHRRLVELEGQLLPHCSGLFVGNENKSADTHQHAGTHRKQLLLCHGWQLPWDTAHSAGLGHPGTAGVCSAPACLLSINAYLLIAHLISSF